MPEQLLLLEFNEINFADVEYYCNLGLLPNFTSLFAKNGWAKTLSEDRYEELEPWIQWVTAHTGKCLAEHGVFRLGDIVSRELPQIWEQLEELGYRVGALSPMNAKHRLRNPAFFVPDPWTETGLTAGRTLRGLHSAIAQAVNDNAQSRLTAHSAWQLLWGFVAYSKIAHGPAYLRLLSTAWRFPWRRAILLDLLLADVFLTEVERTKPDFATLFLNAGAHVQHHYLFSAACYQGAQRNPAWYVSGGVDPVRDAYHTYDVILGAIRRTFPAARIMIATALHQVPHGAGTFYWRLRRHADFLKRIRVPFASVQPRMSRDFLVICESAEQARMAEERLSAAICPAGSRIFSVDNRGTDLFVVLEYPSDIAAGVDFRIHDDTYRISKDDVVFVALKNGEHSGTGYFADTGARIRTDSDTFPLAELPRKIMNALGIETALTSGNSIGNAACGASAAARDTDQVPGRR
ncbi:MAG: hypothetical protein ACREUT_06840 [Steroidobacteraceae bacterium]